MVTGQSAPSSLAMQALALPPLARKRSAPGAAAEDAAGAAAVTWGDDVRGGEAGGAAGAPGLRWPGGLDPNVPHSLQAPPPPPLSY